VVAAAAVLVGLPIVAAYILLQRQFIRGFLAGAGKE
jgi:ABC-type glycerol-3-phosphate transport system permease component